MREIQFAIRISTKQGFFLFFFSFIWITGMSERVRRQRPLTYEQRWGEVGGARRVARMKPMWHQIIDSVSERHSRVQPAKAIGLLFLFIYLFFRWFPSSTCVPVHPQRYVQQ